MIILLQESFLFQKQDVQFTHRDNYESKFSQTFSTYKSIFLEFAALPLYRRWSFWDLAYNYILFYSFLNLILWSVYLQVVMKEYFKWMNIQMRCPVILRSGHRVCYIIKENEIFIYILSYLNLSKRKSSNIFSKISFFYIFFLLKINLQIMRKIIKIKLMNAKTQIKDQMIHCSFL